MRPLTDSEQKIVEKGWLYHLGNRRPSAVDYDFYEAGFIAALDHSEAQIAALQAENKRLREAQFKAVKDLKRIVKGWRDYAAGDYCTTYNPERGKGLSGAADHLENYVHDAYRGE